MLDGDLETHNAGIGTSGNSTYPLGGGFRTQIIILQCEMLALRYVGSPVITGHISHPRGDVPLSLGRDGQDPKNEQGGGIWGGPSPRNRQGILAIAPGEFGNIDFVCLLRFSELFGHTRALFS